MRLHPVGIQVSGNGRTCGFERETFQSGSFTITDLAFGPGGSVERLDATFEQHCNGGDPALRGRVVLSNPPAPALELGVTTAGDGTVSKLNGKATIHGTVTCTQDTTIHLAGEVVQVKKKVVVRGPFSRAVDCVQGQTVPWTAIADPGGTTPFQKGLVEVSGSASAYDPGSEGSTATVELVPTTVKLTRAKA